MNKLNYISIAKKSALIQINELKKYIKYSTKILIGDRFNFKL